MKILIADDSETFLQLMSSLLTKLGHEVIPARSGEEALMLFQQSHPDLIILDVTMSKLSGFECAKQIRRFTAEDWIPIIFLSASVTDESIARGIEAGGDDYLTKPCSEITIEAKIKAMARIAEMRQRLISQKNELNRISVTDMLTGVYNRYYLEKALKSKIAAADRHRQNIGLLFIDIDHFKSINDTFGHAVGDLLLQEVAFRLMKFTRLDDTIARLGGDEFVVILNQIDTPHAAEEVAAKLIFELARDYNINNNNIKISASIGAAFYPQQADNSATLMQNADIAMYAAKEAGRNNYQIYTEELNQRYRHQLGLEHELKFAIQKNQLSITYQPIFNLLNRQIIAAEALVKWDHPEFGSITSDIFMPIAEESGLIMEIGLWVINHICEQGSKWFNKTNKNMTLSINVSIQQLIEENYISQLIERLGHFKINPSNIELEITERNAITYTPRLKESMIKLHDQGMRIAIDDFGTRYSSLTSLRHLPITTLKISKEFVKNVHNDKKNEIIVKSLIALGTNLHLDVVAKGIQNEDELQFLIVNGCEYGQGEYLSKPMQYERLNKKITDEKL